MDIRSGLFASSQLPTGNAQADATEKEGTGGGNDLRVGSRDNMINHLQIGVVITPYSKFRPICPITSQYPIFFWRRNETIAIYMKFCCKIIVIIIQTVCRIIPFNFITTV